MSETFDKLITVLETVWCRTTNECRGALLQRNLTFQSRRTLRLGYSLLEEGTGGYCQRNHLCSTEEGQKQEVVLSSHDSSAVNKFVLESECNGHLVTADL